jgi:hypothetical protein
MATDNRRRREQRGTYYGAGWALLILFLLLTFLMAAVALGLSAVAYSRTNTSCQGLCINGTNGTNGTDGVNGTTNITISGSALDFADFFATMPGDNAATIAVGADVLFPQLGPTKVGSLITAINGHQFNLAVVGTYDISFFVSVSEPGQLQLSLNNAPIAHTTIGRATGTSEIGECLLITTSTVNSVLTVRNPAGNSAALTITPIAGGASAVSAHLRIIQIA